MKEIVIKQDTLGAEFEIREISDEFKEKQMNIEKISRVGSRARR